MKLFLYKTAAKVFLYIHSSAYHWSGHCAARAEGGLHPKHRIMRYHDFFVDRVTGDDDVLDIGCNNGALGYSVAKVAKSVVGIEIKSKHKKSWVEKYAADNITYQVGDATTFSFSKKFDVALLSNVLEHIENRHDFLTRIKPLASTFLFRIPMINRDWVTPYKKELGMYWKCDPTHFIEYTFETFSDELEKAGYQIVEYSIQFGEIWAVAKPL
ncbi:MAG: class I SAM-dependent methyltransferase [Parcubacteria group bacterium]|nr:class I SAM-dependent methyltransferase [Parcubacteria group bacterium]